MPMVSIDTGELYVERSGRGAPVLFLHGLGSSVRDWEFQVPAFSKHFEVITVDMRGHGRSSDLSGKWEIADFARDTARTIDALQLERVDVVGISMGAMIALQLALDHPHRVDRVVAVNSPASMRPRGIGMRLQVLQRKLLVNLLGMRRVGTVLAGRLFPDPAHESIRRTFARRWAENSTSNYRRALNAILRWEIVDRLDEIRTPVLVVAASEDYTPTAAKALLAERLPDGQLRVVEGSHHATPVEMPQAFNRLVLEWLTAR